MSGDHRRYGPFIAALGSALLAWSVFLPWYGVSFTARGIAYMQQNLDQVAQQYGNAVFQSKVSGLHSRLDAVVGQQIATVSAHDVLHVISVILLVCGALALLLSLLRLASVELPLQGSSPLVLLGLLALLCVLYRMGARPGPDGEVVSLSLRGGIWLALGSSIAVILGGLWAPTALTRPANDGQPGAPAPQPTPVAPTPAPTGAPGVIPGAAPATATAALPGTVPPAGGMLLADVPLGQTVFVERGAIRQDLDGSAWINAGAEVSQQPDAERAVKVANAPEGLFVTVPQALSQPPVDNRPPARVDWRRAVVSFA